MSPSLSGNELLLRSFVLEVADDTRVGEARRLAADLALALDFNEVRAARLAIVVNELATNLAKHARGGQLILRAASQFGESFVEVLSVDRGPGIKDLDSAFRDGVTSGVSPGTGLGAIRRQSDLFDIESSSVGTVLVSEVHASDASAARARASSVRISGVCAPIHGEMLAGDSWMVRETSENLEVMIVDGLGHGPLAHDAAASAIRAFESMDADLAIDRKLQILHGALRSTRGAAVSIASLPKSDAVTNDVNFVGVGNVRGVICERAKDRTLLTHPGTAGLQFKSYPINRAAWDRRGAFVMHSDGLQSRWSSAQYMNEMTRHPGILVACLLRDYTRGTDDVTVVAAHYNEPGAYS